MAGEYENGDYAAVIGALRGDASTINQIDFSTDENKQLGDNYYTFLLGSMRGEGQLLDAWDLINDYLSVRGEPAVENLDVQV